MRIFLLTFLIGIVAGTIDVLPMVKMKLDKYALFAAFIFYFIMPFIIFNINILENIWWIKGGIITFILVIPTIIIASKENKFSILPITIMSIIIGSLIGIVGHYLGIM